MTLWILGVLAGLLVAMLIEHAADNNLMGALIAAVLLVAACAVSGHFFPSTT